MNTPITITHIKENKLVNELEYIIDKYIEKNNNIENIIIKLLEENNIDKIKRKLNYILFLLNN
jgi:hypothetical protein